MLEEKYAAHQGKLTDKWQIYLTTYARLLDPLVGMTGSVLEIGIQNGGSLEIWSDYFRLAHRIVGCDINPLCGDLRFADPRVAIVVGDANLDETEDRIASIASTFDVIIDDGSHLSSDIVRSFARYFPRLSDGGLYIAEDLHCSYWADFEGGVGYPASSMAFFKRLADVVNHEHWGTADARRRLLTLFEEQYKLSFDEDALAHIHSIEFINSLCVIRKKAPIENVIGKRVVKGVHAEVVPQVSTLDGIDSIVPPQGNNQWSDLSQLQEDELLALRIDAEKSKKELSARDREIEFLRTSLESRNQEIRHRENEALKLSEIAAVVGQQLQLANGQLNQIKTSASWRWSAPVRSVERLEERLSRVGRRISTVKTNEGGSRRMLKACIRAFKTSGARGVRTYLKQAEKFASGNPAIVNAQLDLEPEACRIFAEQQSEFPRADLVKQIDGFAQTPLISVIMPVYKTPVRWLARVIESLQEQVYPNWELCAVDDCSPTSAQREVLEHYSSIDARVKFQVLSKNSGISVASNQALSMAEGQYIALVDHDDELTPDAFYWIVKKINEVPEVDFLYSDECKIDDTPERRLFHFVFKPDWSPEMLFNGMLTGHLTVYGTDFVRRLGGFRSKYDFSQDYDLALRAGESARRIVHIERVLYLWRSIPGSAAGGGKDFARESNVAALGDHLIRAGVNGVASPSPHANRVAVVIPKDTRVSIVIPSDSYENLRLAISSILEKTNYSHFEIIAVCNSPLAERLSSEYHAEQKIRFSRYDKKYNFSDKCNQGAEDAAGDVVVFYNDDVFPFDENWLTRLIEYLFVPGVGGVSPKLLYKNETIQYAGMISGTPGLCGTAYNHVPRDGNDSFLSMHKYVRNVSILSGACCAFKRDVFLAVGGFDAENTPDGHSDMVLSYKIGAAGYRCVYTPYAMLYHIGHGSWNVKKGKYKADIFALKRWGRYVSDDPWFSDSMKRVLYTDFRFQYKIFASHIDPLREYSAAADVLLVAHELTLTGAPRMLFYAAKSIAENGGFPVVASPKDGPLRAELIKAGIAVIIDASITEDHFLFGSFAKNFDTVIVNTIALTSVVRQLQKYEGLDLVWWLHEGKALASAFAEMKGIEKKRTRIWSVSEYAKQFIPGEYCAEVLYNAVPDLGAQPEAAANEKFTFVLSGTVEPRKGHDILIDAIRLLPDDVRKKGRFLIFGKVWEMHEKFWQDVQRKAQAIPEFEYLGLLDHQAALSVLASSDAVVCCSRDESFSLTVVEGAMLGKPAILSKTVGVAEVLEDGASCVSFDTGDAASLAEELRFAIEHVEEMRRIGAGARRIFEERFTMESFSVRLHQALRKAA